MQICFVDISDSVVASMHSMGWAFFAILGLVFIAESQCTPLDDYVNAADPHFGWTVIRTYEQPDYALYILNFTSQKWFDGEAIVRYRSVYL